MRLLLCIILFIELSLTANSQEVKDIEKVLYDCLNSSFLEKGVNLNNTLTEFENYLLKERILEADAGQSYYDFFKSISNGGKPFESLKVNGFDCLRRLSPKNYYPTVCLKEILNIDSTVVAQSQYFQVIQKLQQISFDGSVALSNIAQTIISVLSPVDFEKPYYRAISLLAIVNLTKLETGIMNHLTFKDSRKSLEVSSVKVKTTENSEIEYNEKVIDVEQLSERLESYIEKNRENHQIILEASRETPYVFYLKVQSCLLEVYKRLREKEANKTYKKVFENLKQEEKEEIMKKYPQNIKG